MTKKNLTKELIKNNGTLAIRIGYTIGEKPYNEQHIFIKKQDSVLAVKIYIDTGSYFLKYKHFKWCDTTITISKSKVDNLVSLEKVLFKKGLQPTYNCDGINGRIMHNQTNILFAYIPDETIMISRELIDTNDYIYEEFKSDECKFKMINVGGGFVSMRDELMNLGIDFARCKTNWWTK